MRVGQDRDTQDHPWNHQRRDHDEVEDAIGEELVAFKQKSSRQADYQAERGDRNGHEEAVLDRSEHINIVEDTHVSATGTGPDAASRSIT